MINLNRYSKDFLWRKIALNQQCLLLEIMKRVLQLLWNSTSAFCFQGIKWWGRRVRAAESGLRSYQHALRNPTIRFSHCWISRRVAIHRKRWSEEKKEQTNLFLAQYSGPINMRGGCSEHVLIVDSSPARPGPARRRRPASQQKHSSTWLRVLPIFTQCSCWLSTAWVRTQSREAARSTIPKSRGWVHSGKGALLPYYYYHGSCYCCGLLAIASNFTCNLLWIKNSVGPLMYSLIKQKCVKLSCQEFAA